MHPEIRKFWEKQGPIFMKSPGHWFLGLEIDPSAMSITHRFPDGHIIYYKDLVTNEYLSEQEMLSFVRLQAFL